MTDILCKWLNDEVCLESKLDSNFAEKFSSGYLLGEILNKFELQPDFHLFSKGGTSYAKLNNFMRLEPTLKLLDIPFSVNTARDIMTEKPGVATRLMYQLYLALNRKKERNLTTQSLECMKPLGRVKLEKVETEIFQGRLKNQTPRQFNLNFEELIQKFQERKQLLEEKIAKQKKEDEEKLFIERMESCQRSMERSRAIREDHQMLYKKLRPVQIVKEIRRARSSPVGIGHNESSSKKIIARETQESIDKFETTLKRKPSFYSSDESSISDEKIAAETSTNMTTGEYLTQLHQRVADSTQARMERDKRRRKVLIEQIKALHEQEEAKREKMLVERLMRQCQQERRIATQLMHIRKEKDTIRNNRILSQQQYAEQKELEFHEALNREARLALLEEKERKQRLAHHQELCRRNLVEKSKKNYKMNYKMCREIMLQMLDFATKLAHYKELTKDLVPAKMVLDWKLLFMTGRPLYGDGSTGPVDALSSTITGSSDESRIYSTNDQLLNDIDFQQYEDVENDWTPPPDLSKDLPERPNVILSHIVYRLLDIVDPPKPPPTPPHTPRFLVRASIVGKPFTGKTTALQQLEKTYGLTIISLESVVTNAVETFLAERKKLLQEQQSSSQEDVAILSSESDVTGTTPRISINPSSSTELLVSSTQTATSERGKAGKKEEGKVDKTHNYKEEVIKKEKRGEEKEEDQKDNVGEEREGEKEEQEEQEEESPPSEGASAIVGEQVSHEQMMLLSPLARLGCKAHSAMASGEVLDDEVLVEIFMNKISSFPDGSGWILDNFPTTVAQAKLLTAALANPPQPKSLLPRDFEFLSERFNTNPGEAASGLDVVLHFNASSEVVLQRASEQDESLPQSSNKLEQIQERLLAHAENWPSLRRWYAKFRSVISVDANKDLQSVCKSASNKIQEVINKNKQADAMKKFGFEGILSSGSVISLTAIPSSPSGLIKKTSSKQVARLHRPSSAESPSPSRKKKRGLKNPQHQKASKSKEAWIPVNLDTRPGGPDWVYYSQPVSEELVKGLAVKWQGIEQTFINTLKQIFSALRNERELICQYFFLRRNEFSSYLSRPDHKQEFISQWQAHYNSVEYYLRYEDEMKAELHHRVDDLVDKLWDICERRDQQAKEEQKRIAEEKWLEDHIGLISNHYVSIMQIEVDRFQDTLLLLKDYYNSMEDKSPEKLPEMGRVPLIELLPTEAQEVASTAASSTLSLTQKQVTDGDSVEAEREEVVMTPAKETLKGRIPLLPCQLNDKEAEERLVSIKKKIIPGLAEVTGVPLEKQMIHQTFNAAITIVSTLVAGEIKILDNMTVSQPTKPVRERKDSLTLDSKDEKSGKSAKKAKGGANNSGGKNPKGSPTNRKSSGKKKDRTPTPSKPPPPVVSEEEVIAKHQKMHMCKEYKEALLHEESRVKVRLELIKHKSLEQINMLKSTSIAMQEEMDQWISNCYNQEIESVNYLADMLRQAIENEEKLLNEIILPGAKFQVDKSVFTYVPTPPSSSPPPVERMDPSYFTVAQLCCLQQQLNVVAPSGFILARLLVDTLLACQSSGDDVFPQLWRHATKQQLEYMIELLYGPDADFVDCRRLLLCTAFPWPLPTSEQLLDAFDTLTVRDGSLDRKMVTKEKFMDCEIWLDQPLEKNQAEETQTEFNREQKIKEALFDIFCEKESGLLDVQEFLLYLCADPKSKQGISKALSVVTRSPVSSLMEDLDPQVTILLKDFHKVLTLGSYSEDTGTISMEELLGIFSKVDPKNPNEIPLVDLLANQTTASLLHLHSSPGYMYFLPDLLLVLRPPVPPVPTDNV